MATYQFLSITDSQAYVFYGSSDELRFDGIAGVTATSFTFSVQHGLVLTLPGVRSVTFGEFVRDEVITLPDGSKLGFPFFLATRIGGSPLGDQLHGSREADQLYGFEGGDILRAEGGNDTLIGGVGADTLTGGEGNDIFVMSTGDSGAGAGQIDVITDWTRQDTLRFEGPLPGIRTAGEAPTYAAALASANGMIAGGVDVVTLEVGTDVYIFADTRNDNGTADDVVRLVGVNRTDVRESQVVGFTTPPPVVPAPTPPAGTLIFEQLTPGQALSYDGAIHDLRFTASSAGASVTFVTFNADNTVTVQSNAQTPARVLTFGAGIQGEANLIFPDNTRVVIGTNGNDILMGSAISDRLFGGPGADTLNGAGNGDALHGGSGADLFVAPARDTNVTANIYDGIADWEPVDRITFGGPTFGTSANYVEGTSGINPTALIESGQADFVAVQSTGILGEPMVQVYADALGTNKVTGRINLSGTLASVDFSNFVAMPAIAFPALPPVSGQSTASAMPGPVTYIGADANIGVAGVFEGNVDTLHLGDLGGAAVTMSTETAFKAGNSALALEMTGVGFTYRVNNGVLLDMPGGTVSHLLGRIPGGFGINLSLPNVSANTLFNWILQDATPQALNTLLAGSDSLTGGENADVMRGLAGHDTLGGMGGNDIVFGGSGDDVIYALAPPGRIGQSVVRTGSTYLRGDEGNDWIAGGTGFDDINGNMGNDTAGGAEGDDWVVGGRDNDLLFGDAGNDLVYGNLGNDTCQGGEGNDIVRGGQGDDVVTAGAGADFVSGDLGSDTLTGGAGADIFNTFAETGLDRVTDFSVAEGDRVQLAPGTTYTLSQVGADTVISMTGGGQMILVGVQVSSLTPGWIFGS